MITHYFRTLKDAELKTLEAPRNGTWTHVVAPTEEELESLVATYGLDEDILKDAQDFFEVPRMEKSDGGVYFFTRYPYDERDEDIDTAPLLLVVGESFVLTMALREVPQFRGF
jgi:magnesium transporter